MFESWWIMNHILPVGVLLAAFFFLPVGAVETAPPDDAMETVTMETETDDKNIIVNVTVPVAPAPTPDPVETPSADVPPVEDVPPAMSPYSVSVPDEVPAPESETALKSIVSALFGEYAPKTQTVTEYLPDGSSVTSQEYVPGVAGMDWHWIAGVGLFSLVLLCLFKLLGGVLTRG